MSDKTLEGTTAVITGASRGIGAEMAYELARNGANVAILARKARLERNLPGTVFEVADQVHRLGGNPLAIEADVRNEWEIIAAVERIAKAFGGINLLINNASTLYFDGIEDDDSVEHFDRMHATIVRGTFICTKHCLPYLKGAENPHVINICPNADADMTDADFAKYGAYALCKAMVSMHTLGMARQCHDDGIVFNGLWPARLIYTAATRRLFGEERAKLITRKPRIMADAAYFLHRFRTFYGETTNGRFFTDELVLRLRDSRVDLTGYAVTPGSTPERDIFV